MKQVDLDLSNQTNSLNQHVYQNARNSAESDGASSMRSPNNSQPPNKHMSPTSTQNRSKRKPESRAHDRQCNPSKLTFLQALKAKQTHSSHRTQNCIKQYPSGRRRRMRNRTASSCWQTLQQPHDGQQSTKPLKRKPESRTRSSNAQLKQALSSPSPQAKQLHGQHSTQTAQNEHPNQELSVVGSQLQTTPFLGKHSRNTRWPTKHKTLKTNTRITSPRSSN